MKPALVAQLKAKIGALAVEEAERMFTSAATEPRGTFFSVASDEIMQWRKMRMQHWAAHTYDGRVQSGPFAGMRYLDIEAFPKEHFYAPKLLGTLEHDLHPYLSDLSKYTSLVNVGCAEGYYSVGPLTVQKALKVSAFDIVEHERTLCRKLAELNGVADRIEIGAECTPGYLMDAMSPRTLAIIDIEGAEVDLLEGCDPARLSGDMIIETHDHNGANSEAALRRHLSETHDITTIPQTFPDVSALPEVMGLRQLDRFLVVWEGRGPHPWLFATPKAVAKDR